VSDAGARVLEWARQQEDVVAVLITGSRARLDGSVDEASDHDLEIYTGDLERYRGTDWLDRIAPVWVVLPFDHADGRRERLVFFAGGAKVDLQVMAADRLEQLAREGLDDVHLRGYRILFDRDGRAARLPPSPHRPPRQRRPTEEEFLAVCTEFWFEAAHIPRSLARGELWVVKFRDWTMKRQLLRMLEWHALAMRGDDVDVWHIGTKAENWLAPGVWERLGDVFARFDREDSLRALQATADLFVDVSRDVARAFELTFPEHMSGTIRRYVTTLPALERRGQRPAG